MHLIIYSLAYVMDLLIGDPYRWPHPIKVIGHAITLLVSKARVMCKSEKHLKIAGLLVWLLIVGTTYFVTWFILKMAAVHPYLYIMISIYLAYTTLATKCLAFEASKIYKTLQHGTIEEARQQLSMIVGRDTSKLNKEQIAKATVETVAENASDGVVAPLFYLFLGGPALAMTYKAVNTLDSMVGYKNEKYKNIGYVSAKMDDVFNYIPSRLTWLFLVGASLILRLSWHQAFTIGWRDRKQHSSPNCAYPEGAVAGALGIQLGGPNMYFGQLVEKPFIGDHLINIEATHIQLTNQLLYVTSCIALLSFIAFDWIIRYFVGLY